MVPNSDGNKAAANLRLTSRKWKYVIMVIYFNQMIEMIMMMFVIRVSVNDNNNNNNNKYNNNNNYYKYYYKICFGL